MLYLAAAAAAAFNLICSGTTEKTDYNGSRSEPYTVTYRVDTAAGLWCKNDEEACKAPQKITNINIATIKFIDTTIDTSAQYFLYIEQVNRESGLHQTLTIGGRSALIRIVKQEGHCAPAEFSGFSKANPKF